MALFYWINITRNLLKLIAEQLHTGWQTTQSAKVHQTYGFQNVTFSHTITEHNMTLKDLKPKVNQLASKVAII